MLFPSRTRSATSRFLAFRIGLFFFAAGVWLAGVVIEDERFTGAAIVILLIAFVLGIVGRRKDAVAAGATKENDDPGEEPL